jgi:hypothetical protein
LNERRFDDLARSLATPMPRRRALRMIGVGLAAGAFPSLRVGRAAAASLKCPSGTTGCGTCANGPGRCCDQNSMCCPDIPFCCGKSGTDASGAPVTVTCGPGPAPEFSPCLERIGCPSSSPVGCGTTSKGAYIYELCCRADQQCAPGASVGDPRHPWVCVGKCPAGQTRCGNNCCKAGFECESGRCVKHCPPAGSAAARNAARPGSAVSMRAAASAHAAEAESIHAARRAARKASFAVATTTVVPAEARRREGVASARTRRVARVSPAARNRTNAHSRATPPGWSKGPPTTSAARRTATSPAQTRAARPATPRWAANSSS